VKNKPSNAKKHKHLRRERFKWPSLARVNVKSSNKFNPTEEDIKHGLRKE